MTDDGRRWVPEGGLQKLKNKIHRESKAADDFKKLPFTFSKPIRKSHAVFVCVECERMFDAPKNTVMVVCPDCKKLVKVRKLDD